MFSYHFDVLMSKIILKKQKNIILICFGMKNIFKNNHYHISKHPLYNRQPYVFGSTIRKIILSFQLF
jgi:hypothetical protein